MKSTITLSLLTGVISLPVHADLPQDVSEKFTQLGNCVAYASMAKKIDHVDNDYYIAMRQALAVKFFDLSEGFTQADTKAAWDKMNVGIGFTTGEAYVIITHNVIVDGLTYHEFGQSGFKRRCAPYHNLEPNKPVIFDK